MFKIFFVLCILALVPVQCAFFECQADSISPFSSTDVAAVLAAEPESVENSDFCLCNGVHHHLLPSLSLFPVQTDLSVVGVGLDYLGQAFPSHRLSLLRPPIYFY
ncbi:MAG: hypothetical protein OXT67_13450 [Zetaproteobacteria bacterium]|nr:hypothetical protein [Zetaproteobacteria bacterium]